MKKHKIVIAVTGASGSIYTKVLFKKLNKISEQIEEIGIIMSDNAKFVWKEELPDVKGFLANRETDKWYILAGLANTAMMVFYYAAIEKAPVVFVVPFLQTSPLFVVIFSYIWIQDIERISWRLVLGVIVMICAAIIITAIA